MIYSTFGCKVELLTNCGKHLMPEYCEVPLNIVHALRLDDNKEKYYLAETLRADGGSVAIAKAIDSLPEVHLDDKFVKELVDTDSL